MPGRPCHRSRSRLFLAMTAEEGGLKVRNTMPRTRWFRRKRRRFALNFDAIFPFGMPKDVVITGTERTTVRPLPQQLARRTKSGDFHGSAAGGRPLLRSDHSSFAHRHSRLSIEDTHDIFGKPAALGSRRTTITIRNATTSRPMNSIRIG